MQILTRRSEPSTIALMVRRLGAKMRLLTLWACDTVFPDTGCFPQISQVLDMVSLQTGSYFRDSRTIYFIPLLIGNPLLEFR